MRHSDSDNKAERNATDIQNLTELATVIRREKDTVLSRWREQVRQLPSAKNLSTPKLNDHVPFLIEELSYAFQSRDDDRILRVPLRGGAPAHGVQRFEHDFDIAEVVAEYNILRGCIYDFAEEHGFPLHGNAFHILNHVFDEAIGVAVQTFITQQTLEVQRRRDEHLGFVVHDLRTPLNAISLAVRILEVVPPEEYSAKIPQMLILLRRNIQRLEGLVEKVLKESTYIQAETKALERREFDLWPLVESLIYDLEPVIRSGGTAVTNRIPKELTVYADAGMLRRIFQNLISSTLKYTRGEIVIEARKNEAGGIECLISSNAIDIPDDQLQKIFDKPETGQEKKGLGLSIVKALVEVHDGEVSAERRSSGTVFRFALPSKPEDANR